MCNILRIAIMFLSNTSKKNSQGAIIMPEISAIKPKRLAVGLMSGTSVDGIDAALVEISGDASSPEVKLVAFKNTPYPAAVREKIFAIFKPENATVDKLGYMNFLLGEYFAMAALAVIEAAGVAPSDVDFIASHGQTIWHAPEVDCSDGFEIRYTVQIGEGAVIAERTGIPTISDFRVADMAAGGQGAPLVPFTEYILYRRESETILLQNIGGIGNMTVLPAGARPDELYAFDTGPGNMIIDAIISAATDGKESFDRDGAAAARGKVCEELLSELKRDEYYALPLPKTTGREHFGTQYTGHLFDYARGHGLTADDLAATATELTAWSIADAYERYVMPKYRASELIVGGGGSYNPTLLAALSRRMNALGVKVRTQEELGFSSDAKEAVAFAIMGDRYMAGLTNTLPSVTGAAHAAIMGKLSLPANAR